MNMIDFDRYWCYYIIIKLNGHETALTHALRCTTAERRMRMLVEERFEKIINIVNKRKSVTVQDLMEALSVSESTIRRDLSSLDTRGDLIKVHGGARAITVKAHDDEIINRKILFPEEKKRIARCAASLVHSSDLVYIDAGTTTEYIVEQLSEKNAVYVTNAVSHARKLAHSGFEVYMVGGRLKRVTEAVIGSTAVDFISRYNFTVGFWGSNGIHRKTGFTTPDHEEAEVKRISMAHCKKKYIVADSSKFGTISPVTFADFKSAALITDRADEGYSDCRNIIIA